MSGPRDEAPRGPAGVAARVVLGAGQRAWRVLPARLRRRLEDRFFYAVFNVTRVTNDGYGWRPEGEADAAAPAADPADPGELDAQPPLR